MMMIIKNVGGHEYAQAKELIYPDGRRELMSYRTTVAIVDAEGWLTVNGLYSRTTIKHLGWFMKEFNLNYYYAKRAYLYRDEYRYNVYTGEIEEVA